MIDPASVICEGPWRAMPKSVTLSRAFTSVGRDQDVVRLDVAVDDPVPVGEAQRLQKLRVGDGGADRERAARHDQLLEAAPSITSMAM